MIKPLLFNFLLCAGLLFLTADLHAQPIQASYIEAEKVYPAMQMIDLGQFDELTLVDSIITLQFLRENDPEKIGQYLQSSFLSRGEQDSSINAGNPWFYKHSPYFTLQASGDGKFQSQIARADNFRLRNQGASIWKKMGRAEFFIGGTEMICMGILMAMPKEVTKWEPDFLTDALKNLKSAFTSPPVNDEDDWGFNFVGHPYAGSLYYNAIRSQDATIFQSFLFSFAQSTIWEYLIEGTAEQPSLQDVIITPIFGTLLGEASHVATVKMRRNGFNWIEKITVMVINPFYVVNNGYRTKNKKVITK